MRRKETPATGAGVYVYWFLVGLLAGFALMFLMAFAPWFTGPPGVGFPTLLG